MYASHQQQQHNSAEYGSFNGQHPYSLPPAIYYSIDVECVAVGTDHNARAVAQISLVVRACPFRYVTVGVIS